MHASTANCVAAAITTLRWDRLYITLHHPFAVRDKNPDHNPLSYLSVSNLLRNMPANG